MQVPPSSNRRRPTAGFGHPTTAAGQSSGVALIITLALLVLLSAIVVAFFSTVTTDVVASKGYEGSANARVLADSAVNLVIGQIRDASTKANQAWISQPGLLRTYDNTGKALSAYKLYSSDKLVVDGTSFNPMQNADDVPQSAAWRTQTALWTDLNSPVADPTRRDASNNPLLTYPILDGNHLTTNNDPLLGQVGELALAANGATSNNTPEDITGFEIVNFDQTHPVEMPVKWLYILKDGTIVPAGAGTAANIAQLTIPSGSQMTPEGEVNDPVARIAYWTDDETAKVNLNTASEGTYWDTPICNSQRTFLPPKPPPKGMIDPTTMFEMDMAEYQPDLHEYQRYPGHPATTCLSPVFGTQFTLLKPYRPDMIEMLYEMTPRIAGVNYNPANPTAPYAGSPDYSSDGGTRRAGNGIQLAGDNSIWPIGIDSDRLYASLDELLFNPVFSANQRNRQTLAPANATTDSSREMLEMAKFFLTAQSRAPEQNLFNKPRVAIWPVNVSTSLRTTYDKTIAFCSTVGASTSNPLPFIFTRQDPTSSTTDFSARNSQIYSYLQNLMSSPIPGYAVTSGASTFAQKYTAPEANQILTEIYDYIRCTNLIDSSDPTVPNTSYTGVTEITPGTSLTKRGQVVPITIGNTRGIGRIATISELSMIMLQCSPSRLPATGPANQSNSYLIEIGLVPELFCPMAGFSALANDIRLKFTKINLTVIAEPSGASFTPFVVTNGQGQPDLYDIGRISDIEDNESKIGGYIGARTLFEGGTTEQVPVRYPLDVGSPHDSVPPTGEITIPKTTTKLTVQGTVTVEIHAPNTGPAIQTLTFNFLDTNSKGAIQVPVPQTGGSYNEFGLGASGSHVQGPRCGRPGSPQGATIIETQDVVRSASAVGVQGDMRLVSAMKNVTVTPANIPIFVPPKPTTLASTSAGVLNANMHSMRQVWQGGYNGFSGGYLVSQAAMGGTLGQNSGQGYNGGNNAQPALPIGIPFVTMANGAPGDWDNGPAFIIDGPYCNKADEGARRHEHGRNSVTGQYDEDAAPYIGWYWNPQDSVTEQTTYFSPNKQIASPVTFGSLPTGVSRGLPWQTLLFRPARSYFPGGANHPGSATTGPPDHLLLDLFWMPVVEPYPISEPFATAGKINLNTQIVPFTNIRRNTGLRAVMQSVKMAALNAGQIDATGTPFILNYKLCGQPGLEGSNGGGENVLVRRNIDIDNTLRQIDYRLFTQNKPFISASEICDIPLLPADVPKNTPGTGYVSTGITSSTAVTSFDNQLGAFWNKNKLTGDNSLERPYSFIYPRLTTRSNTYTVHVRVQTLKKYKASSQNNQFVAGTDDTFNDSTDLITGDFRGSFVVERYLDPNTAGFINSSGQPTDQSDPNATLGPYRFRVLSSKQFAP